MLSRSRGAVAAFVLLFVTYGFFVQGATWGSAVRFDLARALVEQGDIRIDAYHANTGDKAFVDGHFYSDKAPLPSFLAAPGVGLAHAVRAVTGHPVDERVWLALAGGLATGLATGLVTALGGACLLLALQDRDVPPRAAWATTFIVFVGTLLLPYGTLLQGHAPAAGWLMVFFHLAFPGSAAPTVRRGVLAGAAASAAVATEYLVVPALAILGLAALWRHRVVAGRQLAAMTAGAAPGLALLGAYHAAAFGSPFSLGYQHVALPEFQESMRAGLFGITAPDPSVASKLLFAPFRGLLFACPVLVAAAPGLVLLARDGRRAEAVAIALVFACYWLLNAGYSTWWGGWAIGPRHLVPVIPLLGLGVAYAFVRQPRLVMCLGAVSLLFMLAATAVQPEVPDNVENPLFDHLLPSLARGEVSVSEQGFGEPFPARADPARPDRWDAFNLGEALGLRGLFSLLPLVALWGAAGFVLTRRRGALSPA